MSVYVSIEDQEGENLTEVFEVVRLCKRFPETGTCIRFIRETVDASFNSLQSPILVSELEELVPVVTDEIARKELERVLKTVKKFAGKEKTYIRFYGEAKKE